MRTSREESDKMNVLYEASYSGNVSTLKSLIQQPSQILHKISQTAFTETPLHISALLGHHEFTKELLTHKPKLALELDSSRRTALHLASAEGHIDIVKELLKVNNQPCLFLDEEGKIPLHYAAIRGRIEVVQELIKAKPESLRFRDNGKTVFHLCVTYNHLETLEALVALELAITGDLLNFTSSDEAGNTILHLAIMLKRVETIRHLLSIPKLREVASLKNEIGLTVHDILEHSPKDCKIFEIQLMLTKAGIRTEKKGIDSHPHPPPPSTTTDVIDHPVARPQKDNCCIKILTCIGNWCIKILKWIGNWFKHKGDWLEEMRGNLSLVSTVISTITFQALINPPGGFIQGLSSDTTPSLNDSLNCSIPSNNQTFCPGEAILSFNVPEDFLVYVICNTISFFSSLSVTLLLVSGLPMKNKVVIWMLSIGMCITITSLALAYGAAFYMVIPKHLLQTEPALITLRTSFMAWAGLLVLIIVLITLRFLIWLVKKCIRTIKKMSRSWF